MTLAPHERLPDRGRLRATASATRARRSRNDGPPWWFMLPALLLFAAADVTATPSTAIEE